MLLKRIRFYSQTNPLAWWVISVMLSLALYLAVFWFLPGRKTQSWYLMPVCFAIGQPTLLLVTRFSEAKRHDSPVSPTQEQGVGLLSLIVSLLSISVFGASLAGRHLGWPTDRVVLMLFVFSLAALLSLALGYASRRTPTGQWALRSTIGWLLLLVLFLIVRLVERAMSHVS